MNIRFYKNFSKRKNSTKRPSASDNYNDRTCYLKEDTSIDNPSIVLSNREGNMSQTGNPITTSNAIASNANSCSVSFTPIQAGSGTPSPSNPRSISGRTEINLDVNGNIINVPFGETVYGGTCDVISGNITSIVKYLRLNGTESWSQSSSLSPASVAAGYVRYFTTLSSPDLAELNANTICSILPTISTSTYNTQSAGSCRTENTNRYEVLLKSSDFPTASDWRTYLSNNPMDVCYKLAAPKSISISAHVVPLNEGSNTISANADSITINYDISTSGDLPLNYTYAYIDKFKKYYFVSAPVVLTDGIIQYDLEEDPLASHKAEIGSTVAHIAYSSTGWDKDLTDNRIAVKGTKTIYHDSQALPLESVGSGCYIIGVVNGQNDGSKTGALSYYRMSALELSQLIKYMMKKDIWDSIKEYFNGKTMDFIQSCIWVPHTGAGFVGTLQTTFYVGDTAIADYSTVPATPVYIDHYPITTKVLSLGLTSVSLGTKFQDFRDNQPYSSASLYLPGVGLTDLNINDFYESNNVNIETILDITTGDITYKIYDDSNQLLKTVNFNGSASVSMSQINMNAAGAIAGIGGVVGGVVGMGLSALTMNPVAVAGAGVGVLAGASAAVMAANQRSTSIKGTNSGRSGFFTNAASTVVVRQDTEDPDDANFIARCGRPVAATHAISNHSGYVQCEGASVNIAGDTWERDKINSYLNSGFYYE